jgi:peptidoglycan/LPS O-acetylase OafA/YrhL
MILAVIGLNSLGWLHVPLANLIAAVTYTSNYCFGCTGQDAWYLGHTWSLAVEEQFYLLWPATLLLLGKRRGLVVAALLILACPLIRLYYTRVGYLDFYRFETVADSLAVGCVLAGSREWLHSQTWYKQILSSKAVVLMPLLVLFVNFLSVHPSLFPTVIFALLGFTLINVGIVIFVDWSVVNCASKVGVLLNRRTVAFIGIISYSIYLWQQIFLTAEPISPLLAFPINLLMVAVFSLLSYYVIEAPSLRFRKRMESVLFSPLYRPAPAKSAA